MIKYSINKEKKTVVAYFDGDVDYWVESLLNMTRKIFDGEIPNYSYKVIAKALLSLDYDFVGMAKCSPSDGFDISVGKTLAKSRLLRKWGSVKRLVLSEYKKKITHNYNVYNERINKRFW